MKLRWEIEGDDLVIELTRIEDDGREVAESSIRIPRRVLAAGSYTGAVAYAASEAIGRA